jgi:hypothetical protein
VNDISFGDLFTSIRNGLSIKQDKSGDGLPISRIETISNGIIDPSRVGYAGIQLKDGKGWLLQSGDLLFSHINSVEHIGKCAVFRKISRLSHKCRQLFKAVRVFLHDYLFSDNSYISETGRASGGRVLWPVRDGDNR